MTFHWPVTLWRLCVFIAVMQVAHSLACLLSDLQDDGAPNTPNLSPVPTATLSTAEFRDYFPDPAFQCTGGSLRIVAHPDDDLAFQSPDLIHSIRSGECSTTVFLTAGDAGYGTAYAFSREEGIRTAYAWMANTTSGSFSRDTLIIGGHPVAIDTLQTGHAQIQLVWLRLPDGNMDGAGYDATNHTSLYGLFVGDVDSITDITEITSYTLISLQTIILQLILIRRPEIIAILDYLSSDGDHSDHLVSARMVQAAIEGVRLQGRVISYLGYPAQHLPRSSSDDSADYRDKITAFFKYAKFDAEICFEDVVCTEDSVFVKEYEELLLRQIYL